MALNQILEIGNGENMVSSLNVSHAVSCGAYFSPNPFH